MVDDAHRGRRDQGHAPEQPAAGVDDEMRLVRRDREGVDVPDLAVVRHDLVARVVGESTAICEFRVRKADWASSNIPGIGGTAIDGLLVGRGAARRAVCPPESIGKRPLRGARRWAQALSRAPALAASRIPMTAPRATHDAPKRKAT